MCRSDTEKARASRKLLCKALEAAVDSADEQHLKTALKASLVTLWAIGACGKYDSNRNCGAAADDCLKKFATILGVNHV